MKKPKDREADDNLSRPILDGGEFKNVAFTYPGSKEPTLRDLSLR